MAKENTTLYKRIEGEISNWYSREIEISPEVKYSQYNTVKRIYKFRNGDLDGSKLDSDLSYKYYFDIISPRVDSTIKNLRFDSKNVLVFSNNPQKDFAAVFLSNASLKNWMTENGENIKLKTSVEEFVSNGNVIFKKVDGGYEICDLLNTIVTNQRAEDINDTDIIERHEMTASQIRRMTAWKQEAVNDTIKNLGNKYFKSSPEGTENDTTGKRYEIFEFTGEVSEKEYNEVAGIKEEGSEDTYFLAKIIMAGLKEGGTGEKYTLFAEQLAAKEKMSDYYKSAHFGRYTGRFLRVGLYEMLFDHQIRANQIGNQLAKGLEWASKVVFRSRDSKVLQNIRADIDNGDVIITEDLAQVDVRMHNLDQLIADWNRLMNDADRLANSYEVVRGESMPSGTPFRMGLLADQNAGKLFTLLRQKLTLPYKAVFKEWVLPELIKDMKGKDVFRFVGETDILDQLREIIVESWYANNLVAIGPHTKETAIAIKQEKLDEARRLDPAIKNSKEIWESVLPRLYVTITGEGYDLSDQIQDITGLLQYEQDPMRLAWMLDQIYRVRNIPIPPKPMQQPPDPREAIEREKQVTEQVQPPQPSPDQSLA